MTFDRRKSFVEYDVLALPSEADFKSQFQVKYTALPPPFMLTCWGMSRLQLRHFIGHF